MALLASSETEEKTVLDGIDISNYQSGIDTANISADFVIVKATEGTTYLSPSFKTQADAVLSSGKLLGIYHFARTGSTALAQAEYFVKTVKDYLGKAVLFLDWENTSYSDIEAEGTGWCKQWLDAVYEMTGVHPIIYMSKNSVLTYDFSDIASDYGLWVAQYADMSRHDGYQEDPWMSSSNYGSWTSGPALFQYSSTTYLSGYNGALDVDKFYGTKEAWMKYAAQQSVDTGWKLEDGELHYYDSKDVKHTGWLTCADGQKYYFSSAGELETGWQTLSGSRYYFADDGHMATGWIDVDGSGYYFGDDGIVKTGWQKVDGSWYYLDASGVMQTGWFTDMDGSQYYLMQSGAMATGWCQIDKVWYYFDASGRKCTGWQTIDGKKYLLDANGAMQTGWQKVDGTWCWLDENGIMKTGWYQDSAGTWYWLSDTGAMQTGWQKIGGTWYYFYGSGAMATGWANVGGTWYYLLDSGAMAVGWVNVGGTWYYLTGSGAMATGWQPINGSWYYLSGSGAMLHDCWVGNYYLGPSGAMLTNARTPDGYYVGPDGAWIH